MEPIDAVRGFNRFYTRRIGVLPEGYLGTPYTLAEARLLYELAQGGEHTATALGRELAMDLGYLSRLLQGLRRRGLVQGRRAAHDRRQSLLSLSEKGRKAFGALNARSREQTAAMLAPLPREERARLATAMGTIRRLLDEQEPAKPQVELRAHRPGDMGWVVERHGAIYFAEYRWGALFEALVAGIVKDFLEGYDPARERCWIAESGGERLGCVFLVSASKTTAKLRLLIVEPRARGLGLGRRLVRECIEFARAKGYRKLVLWTHANLAAARAIYRGTGFRLVRSEAHRSFGPRVMGEYWELPLAP